MSPSERVAKGAAWLDANASNWRSKIIKDELNLRDFQCCILGQVFGATMPNGLPAMVPSQTKGVMKYAHLANHLLDHGFAVDSTEHEIMLEEWKKVI